jgi:hypothetical protein
MVRMLGVEMTFASLYCERAEKKTPAEGMFFV